MGLTYYGLFQGSCSYWSQQRHWPRHWYSSFSTSSSLILTYVRVRHLALQYPKSAFNNGPLLIYLTARNKERGEEALKSIHNDAKLKEARVLARDGGLAEVKYHPLDISETNSIRVFSDYLKREHPEGIDFVINNAGIAMDGFGEGSFF